jgi:hypothetical protein
MAPDVLQRFAWDGRPTEIGTTWTLQKRGHRACCRVVTHLLGFELRLDVDGDLARSAVCRSVAEVETTLAQWRAGLDGAGWTDAPG